jgi:hypothetical protein
LVFTITNSAWAGYAHHMEVEKDEDSFGHVGFDGWYGGERFRRRL